MKHLFVVNPIAGGRDKTGELRPRIEEAFRNRADAFEIYVTKGPMDAAEEIRRRAKSGEELRVYACGGDGTFNECVCGAAGLENVAVAPFPTGTGNDFCRMFGEDKDRFRDLAALLDGGVVRIDLIDCNGRCSANICSVGIDARIGTEVHRYSHLPLVGGAGGYVISTVVNLFRGISQRMRVRCGDFYADEPHTLVAACNGRYYGGGFHPSLNARPDDGLLDFYIVRAVSFFTFVRLVGQYAAGKADAYPKYITHCRGRELHIEFDRESVVNVDGEALYASAVDIRLLPRALRLIVPKGMRFFDDPAV